MNHDAELVLAPPAPPSLVAALSHVPGLHVRRDDARSYLRYGSQEWDLYLLSRSAVDGAEQIEQLGAQVAEDDHERPLPLVVATSLPQSLRRELTSRQISYVDARGHIHLRVPGYFAYIDAPAEAVKPPPSGRTSGIGLVGIRTVQMLATAPDRAWKVTELAAESDVSPGEAHKVLTRLEAEGVIESRGRGPARRRRVRDLGGLLDWLVAQPSARRIYRHLTCSLYARTPADLARRVSHTLDDAETPHAFTAGLAAALLKSGPTSVPRSVLRVDPDRALEEIAATIGAEITERGANLTLWSDDGLVGSHARIRHAETWIAPPVRVYLDLMADRRGMDAAAHFREVILGA